MSQAEKAGPDGGDRVFGGGGGRCGGGAGSVVAGGGGGEGIAVELAACGEGEAGGKADSGGDSGGGEALGEPGADRRGVGGGAFGGDEMGGELDAAGSAAMGDGGGGDAGVVAQYGFDFSGFDALPEDLDLVVVAAVELEHPVAGIAGEVTGAVHAAAGRAAGVGDEYGGGLGRSAEVTVADTRAGDAQFAWRAGRDGPLPVVQDADEGVAEGPADQRHGAVGDGADGDLDGGFGRAVRVEGGGGGAGAQGGPQVGGAGFAAEGDQARRAGSVEQPGFHVELQLGGSAFDGGDRPGWVGGEADQVSGVLALPGGEHDQGVAAGQGGELDDEEVGDERRRAGRDPQFF